MPRQFVIEFDKGPRDSSLLHRIGNFGEDLSREFSAKGCAIIPLEELDRITTKLHVTVRRESDLGSVMRIIKTLLKKHHFEDSAKVSRD